MTNYLSTKEVAARLSVSTKWVRAAIVAGELPAVNVSKGKRAVYRVNEGDLIAFMNERAVTGIEGG
ncbi:helix-turn-helix domain-containing protein [Halodesulfovibrio aestuarii]|uniref:Helix-turn-helix domain-containing protein n=1 Tax=Halodesulfovibrio aestuarii TaxID=126333 RepID=A0ABV4JQG3_9BACT